MPSLKGINVEALMKLRDQVDERVLFVAIGLGVGMMGLDISKPIRRDLGRKRSKAYMACCCD